MTKYRDVCRLGTQLNFSSMGRGLEKEVIGLNITSTKNINELNYQSKKNIVDLVKTTFEKGDSIYGSSCNLEDNISSLKMYNGNSLSDCDPHGFMGQKGQQITLGVNSEELAFDLYDLFRKINPLILTLTASSPYRVKDGRIRSTGNESARIEKFEDLCRDMNPAVWQKMPYLRSMEEYEGKIAKITGNNATLRSNWMVDVQKSDEGNSFENKLYQVKLRIADMPTTIERVQMINSFVAGLAYYTADHGAVSTFPLVGDFVDLKNAARNGLDASFGIHKTRNIIPEYVSFASKGLKERGYSSAMEQLGVIEKVLSYGNDADELRKFGPWSKNKLKNYLNFRLLEGESKNGLAKSHGFSNPQISERELKNYSDRPSDYFHSRVINSEAKEDEE